MLPVKMNKNTFALRKRSSLFTMKSNVFFTFCVGFVGQGLLTAAVCGRVFSSPPAGAVLAAIRAARSSENGTVTCA